MAWQQIAKEAQDHRDNTMAQVQSTLSASPKVQLETDDIQNTAVEQARVLLPAQDVHITEMLPEDLITALGTGQVSATDVVNAYLRRAVVAQKLVSSLPTCWISS